MKNIRVRFAPSPTGYLHVGGLRTALYNYLFARHNDGKFILRIEDTDRSRFVEGAVENLINTLDKCGIKSDEGPHSGGQFGPYIQSERQNLYLEHAEILLKRNKAYKCFCTTDRLQEMREKQVVNGEATVYDGHCRQLTQKEITDSENSGIPFTVRLKVPEAGTLILNDMVREKVEFELPLIDDQILLKSDGYPTYHLANVVDDHFMEISHVIRGEEWLPSTPKHILMYEAFDWEVPQFAHLPLLLNPDRSKLSKRQGDVAVEDYLKKGYLAESLINFVALLGWNPGTDQELFSKEEMIALFSIERIHKAGAVFDTEKLNWMNGQYIRNLTEEEYLQQIKPFISDPLEEKYHSNDIDKIARVIREKIDTLSQAVDHLNLFLNHEVHIEEDEDREIVELESSKVVFSTLIAKLENLHSLDAQSFKQTMKEIQNETGIKGKLLFMPVRIALTGQMHGPDLALTTEIFGREKVIKRLALFI